MEKNWLYQTFNKKAKNLENIDPDAVMIKPIFHSERLVSFFGLLPKNMKKESTLVFLIIVHVRLLIFKIFQPKVNAKMSKNQ